MDFGKLANVDRIDFTLPKDSPRNARVLQSPRSRELRVYVGAPRWAVKEWVGSLFPLKTPAKDFLRVYSRRFNTIELNTTFYRTPDAKTVQGWKAEVPEGFRFAPKVVQSVSHIQDPSISRRELREFCEAVQGFEENLGVSFLQLPPTWGPAREGELKRLLEVLPERFRLAVEFRHPSWFAAGELRLSILDYLEARAISTVITDTAGRRDVVHSCLTTRTAMVRFVCNALHPSDYLRSGDWVDRLKSWKDLGIEEIYFFVHQPTDEHVPELADHVIEQMSRHGVTSLKKVSQAENSDQMCLF
jgi:uncharacterized protein YecE (DUF72 family)